MRVGDIVFVIDTDAPAMYPYWCTTVNATTGVATIAAGAFS